MKHIENFDEIKFSEIIKLNRELGNNLSTAKNMISPLLVTLH